jgi:hypothetical protein
MTTTDRFREFIDSQIKANPVEARITRKVVKALREAGTPVVTVWDTGVHTPVKTTRDVLDLVFNLDYCYLYTEAQDWVFLVGGNEYDMISDYTIDLEAALKPVFAWIEKNDR